MKKIIEYRTLTYRDDSGRAAVPIDANVNELIAEGWQPLGHMVIAFADTNCGRGYETTYAQTMVKYED